MSKADYLSECMSEFRGAPIDAFNKEFCLVCSNRECSRSWGNSSVFDNRVKNWRKVLFESVPRVPGLSKIAFEPTDRVPEVSVKKFEPIMHDLDDDIPDTDPMGPIVTTSATPPISSSSPELITAPPSIPAAPAVPNMVNTPFVQPLVIGGGKPTEETKAEPGCVFVFDDDE